MSLKGNERAMMYQSKKYTYLTIYELYFIMIPSLYHWVFKEASLHNQSELELLNQARLSSALTYPTSPLSVGEERGAAGHKQRLEGRDHQFNALR